MRNPCNMKSRLVKTSTSISNTLFTNRLASKGKSMADPTYEMEMSGVKTFLAMQSDSKDYSKDDSILNDSDHVS